MTRISSLLIAAALALGLGTQATAQTALNDYPDATPVLTDKVLGVDDPAGTWSTKLFSFQDTMDLFEANMSVDLSAFTLTGTLAEFNTALSDGDFASLTGAETLTGKTLTTPVIAQINDANSNEVLILSATASAVNELTVANAATGGDPTFSATGGDTDIGIALAPKGSGDIALGTVTIDADQALTATEDGFVWTYDDGTGKVAFAAAAGGTPGGSDTQVQFNDGGAFGGDAGLTYDKTNKALTVGGATVTTSNPVLDGSQTWNDGAVTFTGIKFNATATANAAQSPLLDLQVDGASLWQLTTADSGNSRQGVFGFNSGGASIDTFYDNNGKLVEHYFNGGVLLWSEIRTGTNNARIQLANDAFFGWGDLALYRDAADTLALRRGTNPTTLNVYNTFTDLSNHERGGFKWNTNVLEVFSEAAGTGTQRPMSLTPSDLRMPNLPTSDPAVAGQLWNNSGVVTVSAG